MIQKSYFRSSGFLETDVILTESGVNLDLRKLPPFLRTLLVTDGTVTKSLEAWFWERIKVEPVGNQLEEYQSTVQDIELEIDSGDKLLKREVILKGVTSNKTYATARSTVSLKYLPRDISLGLENGEIGIGELLREKGIETYRDIFNIDYYTALPENKKILCLLETEVLSRSYRIRVNGHPAILVTEFFPIDIYN